MIHTSHVTVNYLFFDLLDITQARLIDISKCSLLY